MILGLIVFWVGCALTINIASAFGKVETKETGPWNVGIGTLVILIAAYGFLTELNGALTYWWTAQVLLFGFTFLFLGITTIAGFDGRGFGWYCLFVAAMCPLCIYQTFLTGDILLTLIWLMWCILWFLFWVMFALKKDIGKHVRWFQIFCLFFTMLIPGLIMMNNGWPLLLI